LEEKNVEKPMNVIEAASFLRCAVSTVYRDVSLERIPHIHMGRRVLFLPSELLEWIKENRENDKGVSA
jgi:excisionase family DNA binding protein